VLDGKTEQHVCIKFCMKFGRSVTKTLEMFLEAFGKYSLSHTVVSEWHSRPKAGYMSFEEDEHSRLYSTSKMTEGHC
jgi:hypothetical protein